ncbi:MAG: hypothetical protein GTN62_02335 [Gemmatimonadales bacterium]|nr:hypothetical protein [Gemmatimonadales bacterium]NIN10792.1 hypothetical protein [Gemmatimonadales bacterium]NIN48938.1 hypothetical protein [Gemmatimonadales bacterium]NIP06402.1 hypothetical protein [Gemmatimonadales bacterium]NIR00213.1 hypothetical protein [Gemmatimonadales bacterium]
MRLESVTVRAPASRFPGFTAAAIFHDLDFVSDHQNLGLLTSPATIARSGMAGKVNWSCENGATAGQSSVRRQVQQGSDPPPPLPPG